MDPIATKKIKNSVQVLTTALMEILRNTGRRSEDVANFQKGVWNLDASGEEFPELRVLRDLALDLDYYRPGVTKGHGDSSTFGDDRLEAKIDAAIRKLTQPNRS